VIEKKLVMVKVKKAMRMDVFEVRTIKEI